MSDDLTPGKPKEPPPLLPCDTSTFPWEIVPKTVCYIETFLRYSMSFLLFYLLLVN